MTKSRTLRRDEVTGVPRHRGGLAANVDPPAVGRDAFALALDAAHGAARHGIESGK